MLLSSGHMSCMGNKQTQNKRTISVEIACATPEKQLVIGLDVPPGTSARKAVEMSGIQKEFCNLDITSSVLGVFGMVVADSQQLNEHDRVEIYRPLINDPRDTRRALAAQGATMGADATSTRLKTE